MSSRDLIPGTDAGAAKWIVHLASKIETHAPALAITKQDIQDLKDDAAAIDWTITVLEAYRATAQQLTAFKDALLDGQTGGAALLVPVLPKLATAPTAVPAGAIQRTRALVQRIKKSPGYTDAIGKDLGIVATLPEAPAVAAKPTFRATALPGSEVRLDWVKAGYSGVTIQCKRTGEADWAALGRDDYSPFNDKRPPVTPGAPETRQYRLRYLKKDDEVGDWSDIVTVVTIA